MTKEEVLEKILKGYKSIVAYYPYPTGGLGTENEVIRIKHSDEDMQRLVYYNLITVMVQLGAASVGSRNDNKTAVKVKVDGLDFPVYFVKYDGECYITTEINIRRSQEVKAHWNVEY